MKTPNSEAAVRSLDVPRARRAPPGPEATYVGLTATIYHLIGLYGGAVLMLGSAFGPQGWFHRKARRNAQY